MQKRTKKGIAEILLQIYYNKFSFFLAKHLEFFHKCVTIILHGIYEFGTVVSYRCIRQENADTNAKETKKKL